MNKVILQGQLEFNGLRSYEMAFDLFINRAELIYKNDVFLKVEDVFKPNLMLLRVARIVLETSLSRWKNTIALLNQIAPYAIAGKIEGWLLSEGKLLEYVFIEPKSDKIAVRSFIKGKKLSKVKGKEEEAHKALSKAIDKHEAHSHAYERRALVNLKLGNNEDAKYDFGKSIRINPENADAYFGRGAMRFLEKDFEGAISDFESCCKFAIAWQSVYWRSRRKKAEAHIKLKQFDKAEFDLRYLTNRKFNENDPNYSWVRWSHFQYGKVLAKLDRPEDAVKQFDLAIKLPSKGRVPDKSILFTRGDVKQKAGFSGFKADFTAAADLGHKTAQNRLAKK